MDGTSRIARGDLYEDCRYHPMPCVTADLSTPAEVAAPPDIG
jgi:hypothetical protein